MDDQRDRDPVSAPARGMETTASLLNRMRSGDATARDRLLGRYYDALKRWTHGRLPNYARDLLDTDDLVQNCLVRTLDHMKGFEPRREGAFLAYLRRIILNQIRDEIRRVRRRPGHDELQEDQADDGPSPIQIAIGRQKLEKYETALARLPSDQQEGRRRDPADERRDDRVPQALGGLHAPVLLGRVRGGRRLEVTGKSAKMIPPAPAT